MLQLQGIELFHSPMPKVLDVLIDETDGLLKYQVAFIYFDDIVVYSFEFDIYITDLQKVLRVVDFASFRFNVEECIFATQEMVYLGYKTTATRVSSNINKVCVVNTQPTFVSAMEWKGCLGLTAYY